MSDSLLGESEKEYEYEDEDGVIASLKDAIARVSSKMNEIRSKGEDQEDEEEEEQVHGSLSFREDDEENEDDNWRNKVDRFTVVVVAVEVFLLIYFILALLGFAPFF